MQAAPAATTTARTLGSAAAQQLFARLSTALRAQTSFHFTLAGREGGQGFRCDVQFASNGGEGRFTELPSGLRYHIVSVGSDLFISAPDAQRSPSFQSGSDAVAKQALASGKYLHFRTHPANVSISTFAADAGWANRDVLIRRPFGINGLGATTFMDRGTTVVAGRSVTRYDSQGGGADPGFQLDVAATGQPLPIHIASRPSAAVALTTDFTNYGAPAVVQRPPASQVAP